MTEEMHGGEMRAEYDIRGGVRGKYHQQYTTTITFEESEFLAKSTATALWADTVVISMQPRITMEDRRNAMQWTKMRENRRNAMQWTKQLECGCQAIVVVIHAMGCSRGHEIVAVELADTPPLAPTTEAVPEQPAQYD